LAILKHMKIVIALGGNALLKKGQPLDIEIQKQNISRAASLIAEVAKQHSVIITHGNGPQVGLLALQAESYKQAYPIPLDILDAESEGMLGYQIEQELMNQLPEKDIASLLTQVLVDANDPAFNHPTKPIGPVYPESNQQQMKDKNTWTYTRVKEGLRRVVPSPEPKQILELAAIKILMKNNVIVICAGGGGIPVIRDQNGHLKGVEAVIDKDLSSALLARELKADLLLLLTDIDAVYKDWNSTNAEPIQQATVSALRSLKFESGSMAPKVEAACRFVESTGRDAYIGQLEDLQKILRGDRGTKIINSIKSPE